MCLNKWLEFTEIFHFLININEHIWFIIRLCGPLFPWWISSCGLFFVINFPMLVLNNYYKITQNCQATCKAMIFMCSTYRQRCVHMLYLCTWCVWRVQAIWHSLTVGLISKAQLYVWRRNGVGVSRAWPDRSRLQMQITARSPAKTALHANNRILLCFMFPFMQQFSAKAKV